MRRAAMTKPEKGEDLQLTPKFIYLTLYNFVQALGWTIIAIKALVFIGLHKSYIGLYDDLQFLLNFFQTLALLEILHAATGIVKSNPVLTGFQVMSRVFLVWGVAHIVKETHDQVGILLIVIAWTITEIIRYSYYMGALSNYIPFPIQYLRYTLFIVLYPLGVTGELLSVYSALPHVRKRDIWTINLPNAANMSFNYYLVLIFIGLSYFPLFPQLYMHMFAQRRKVLGGDQHYKKE